MHFFCKAIGFTNPRGQHIELISRFGRLQAIHVEMDNGEWTCMKGNEMSFYLKAVTHGFVDGS